MKKLLTTIATCLLVCANVFAAVTGKPNILYILCDDLGYGDFVMETDWAVGELLAALDNAAIAENTLVMFTSDNGCSPAAKWIRQLNFTR